MALPREATSRAAIQAPRPAKAGRSGGGTDPLDQDTEFTIA